jgi:hypothetical protein
LVDVFNSLENPKLNKNSFKSKGTPVSSQAFLPIEEQLTSDDIQQVYANRLHFQQKVK